jgi:ATP-dependent DNA helicase RecQ
VSSLLQRLALEPSQYAALPSDACERVVDFLLRWQAFGEALACLEALGPLAPAQQDQRAAALHGMRRTAEAIAVLERRMEQQDSLPAAMQRVRLQAAEGQVAAAMAAARNLASRSGGGPTASAQGQSILPLGPATLLLADMLLAAGEMGEAEAILLQAHKDAPGSRQPLLGLMRVQQQRSDPVTASAYAMQALDLARRGPELSVEEMTELRTVLQATGDAHRVRDLNQQLIARFDRELAEMQALLANAQQLANAGDPATQVAATQVAATQVAAATRVATTRTAAANVPPASDWAPISPAAALSSITVTAKERHELAAAAKSMFGYAQLLPGQAEVLACVRRREHVLAVMPTGAGKSLCYQLPAFLDEGITLVVSPLVALMKDQIDGLPAPLRRQAVAVNSSLDGDDLRRVVERIATRHYRLVYVAPERLRQLPFIHALRAGGVVRLVVDEAHCVSIWGHDFRPDYLHLAQAHLDLGGPPILAMTATAPPRVRHDIERQLLSRQAAYQGAMRVLVGDTYRPNLHLTAMRVRDDEEQQEKLVALLRQLSGAGVVYVRSRKRCDELAELLVAYGVRAAAYHAGLSDRSEVQDRFMRNELAVIVATVAFGMGVDKPDIRFIVHCGLPNSVEGYYQEIGRAGRDGQTAHCILLYNEGDSRTLLRLAAGSQVAVESVRKAYAAVRKALGGNATGPVPLENIAHAVQCTEIQARTLLGVLEQTGLLLRHYDAPQTLTIQRLPQRNGRRTDGGELDRTFYDFLQRANLDTRATASGDFLSLAAATGIAPAALETYLLSWQAAGYLRYYPAGRVPLVSLPPSPANAAQRVESLVTQRAAVAQQRVQEIDAYAHTRACRHLYLGEYLGSAPATGLRKPGQHDGGQGKPGLCGVCDNCGEGLHVPDAADGPSAADLVLGALVEQSWGRRTLLRLLRGDPEASERAQASGSYGCLRSRSEQSLGQLIDSLLGEGLIVERKLDHGGVTLEATRQGLESLRHGGKSNRRGNDKRAGKTEQRPASAYARWHKKG